MPGTEGAWRPFWSPDSRYLAFTSGGQLRKIAAAGGPVQLVGETKGGFDGTWGSKDLILFDGASQDSIRGISIAGGPVFSASTIDHEHHEQFHCWPTFLPDGEHFIYLSSTDTTLGVATQSFVAKVGCIGTNEVKSLFVTDSKVEYDPKGYLLYVLNGILMARPFNAANQELTGDASPVADHLAAQVGNAGFSISNNGLLVYQPQGGSSVSELVWVDRNGKELSKIGDPNAYRDIMISPDGKRLAYGYLDPQLNSEDIWVRDLDHNVSSRLTFDPKDDIWPVWTPDGARIAFASIRSGVYGLMWKVSNGTGVDEQLYEDRLVHLGPYSFSRDGRFLSVGRLSQGQWDIGIVDITNRTARWLTSSNFDEQFPDLSPDGRFVAYQSNETGIPQIYVLEIGGSGGKWQISSSRGLAPLWRADGKELYFIERGNIMAVPISIGNTFERGTPVKLFEVRLDASGFRNRRYDVMPDGQRFILNRQLGVSTQASFVVVENWTEELVKR